MVLWESYIYGGRVSSIAYITATERLMSVFVLCEFNLFYFYCNATSETLGIYHLEVHVSHVKLNVNAIHFTRK